MKSTLVSCRSLALLLFVASGTTFGQSISAALDPIAPVVAEGTVVVGGLDGTVYGFAVEGSRA